MAPTKATRESAADALARIRGALDTLGPDAPPAERARLQLSAGLALIELGPSHLREAAEELYQALDGADVQADPALHAAVRLHLGRALSLGGSTDEAARHLERAHELFERLDRVAERIEAAREWAVALDAQGRSAQAEELLRKEAARTPEPYCARARVALAMLCLRDPTSRSEGEAHLLACFTEEPSSGVDDDILDLLGACSTKLSPDLRRRAIGWLAARPSSPIELTVALRSGLGSAPAGALEEQLTAEERARLVARMDDVTAPVRERCRAAQTLLCSLGAADRPLRLRAVRAAEGWLDSDEISPLQRMYYRNDLGAALIALADGDRGLLDAAVRHLEAARAQLPSEDRGAASHNLAAALLDKLTLDAPVSVPARAEEAKRIADIAASLPGDRAVHVVLAAIERLLGAGELTHPACTRAAGEMVEHLLSRDPDDQEAQALAYRRAWILHEQGRSTSDALARQGVEAQRFGPLPQLEARAPEGVAPDHYRVVVHALAGTGTLDGIDLSVMRPVLRVRPDAVDLMLGEVERRFARAHPRDPVRGVLLEGIALALSLPVPGDEQERARRMATLAVEASSNLPAADLERVIALLRGPIGDAVREAVVSAGAASAAEPVVTASLEDLQRQQQRGLDLMAQAQRADDTAERRRLLEEAVAVLDRVRALADREAPYQRSVIHVSAGNARRHLARFDPQRAARLLEEAEALYREALPWAEGSADHHARVSKVLADCLVQRRDEPGWEEAMRLYQAALQIRRGGHMRAETLIAVAEAELSCPGRAPGPCLKAALLRLAEALACLPTGEANLRPAIRGRMLALLRQLRQGGTWDPDIVRAARDLAERCPEVASDVALALQGFTAGPPREADLADAVLSPFCIAATESMQAILPPISLQEIPPHLRDGMRPFIESRAADRRNDPEALRAEAVRLQEAPKGEDDAHRAGRLLGRARVLARLVEMGRATPAEHDPVAAAAEDAIRGLSRIADRTHGLVELSWCWQRRAAGGDFARAAKMLEEALAMCPKEAVLVRLDAMQYHAHATRFREDMPLAARIDASIRGYEELARRYQEAGNVKSFLLVQRNLAEAVSQREDRPSAQAWREAIAIDRNAIALARSAGAPEMLGSLLGGLAWTLTRLADAPGVPPDEGRRLLEEAGPLYLEAEPLIADALELESLRNNRRSWEMATRVGSERAEVLPGWREQLAGIDAAARPQAWAMTAHNLAEELVVAGTAAALREAIALYRRALELRPMERGARFRWETAHQLGALLSGLRPGSEGVDLTSAGVTQAAAHREAVDTLRVALAAAREQGTGDQLVRTAGVLGRLAARVGSGEGPNLSLADEALRAIWEVLSIAPDDVQAATAEASIASAMASALFSFRTRGRPEGEPLSGAFAWEILHWMLLARGGQHRRLRARMRRPERCAAETWTQWRLSLRQPDAAERRRAAAAVRAEFPSFLGGAPDLTATFRWMSAEQAAAGTLLESPAGWLLAVVVMDRDAPRPLVVRLSQAPSEPRLMTFQEALGAPARSGPGTAATTALLDEARAALDRLGEWLGGAVVPVLRAALPPGTATFLWSPHGVAAAAPLALFWPDAPPVWTTPCVTLPPPPAAPAISSALLVMADPERPGTPKAIWGGADTMAHLARVLSPMVGQIEVLLGAADRVGADAAQGRAVPGLLAETGPTPREVYQRLRDHRLVIVLAHGSYDAKQPERSALLLLDAAGRPAPLTAEELAETPDLLSGAVVVMMSCEAGAAGDLSTAPSGLAGVLLAVGAAIVVAPLWPVRAAVAIETGEAVAGALADRRGSGEPLPAVVHRVQEALAHEPALTHAFERGQFVVWTG